MLRVQGSGFRGLTALLMMSVDICITAAPLSPKARKGGFRPLSVLTHPLLLLHPTGKWHVRGSCGNQIHTVVCCVYPAFGHVSHLVPHLAAAGMRPPLRILAAPRPSSASASGSRPLSRAALAERGGQRRAEGGRGGKREEIGRGGA